MLRTGGTGSYVNLQVKIRKTHCVGQCDRCGAVTEGGGQNSGAAMFGTGGPASHPKKLELNTKSPQWFSGKNRMYGVPNVCFGGGRRGVDDWPMNAFDPKQG